MTKALRLSLVCVALLALGVGTCCAAVHPTVSYQSEAPFEYSWTVTCTQATTVSFYQFTVFTAVPQAVWNTVAWSQTGPWVGDVNKGWLFTAAPDTSTPANNMTVRWDAPLDQRVPAYTAWAGTFKLTVPNTGPVQGLVKTYGGTLYSNTTTNTVPGLVPEPSSLAAIATMLGGLASLARRRRK